MSHVLKAPSSSHVRNNIRSLVFTLSSSVRMICNTIHLSPQSSIDIRGSSASQTMTKPAATERAKPKPVDSDSAKELLEELLNSEQFGQRGEAWFALQIILSVLVLFPPGGIRQIVDVLGYCALIFGLGLISVAGFDLGQSLTPVPKPRDNNVLTTSGAYELCRHPMYVYDNVFFLFGVDWI